MVKAINIWKTLGAAFLGVGALSVCSAAIIHTFNDNSITEAAGIDYSTANSYHNSNNASSLFSTLQNLTMVSNSNTYAKLWTTYTTVFKKSNGKIKDYYSNTSSFTPSTGQCGNYDGENDCYNREHSIPKSWWGSSESNQGCDPFIVVPTDGFVNSKRSNYPMGVVKTATYSSNNGYSKLGSSVDTYGYSGTVFEPNDEVKGDFARIHFYACVRYSHKDSGYSDYPTYNWTRADGGDSTFSGSVNTNFCLTNYAVKLFTAWNELDPPDDWERSVNEGIYGIQKNRNPFIDHPEYVNTLWGNVSGATTYTGGGSSESSSSETGGSSGQSTSSDASSESTSSTYSLYSGTITEGDYLIVYDGKAMKNEVASNRLAYESVTPVNNTISTNESSIIWHIAPSGNYWTIYNSDANQYAASTGTKSQAQLLDSGTDNKSLWTVSGTSTYEFVNKQNAASSVNANLRENGTYGFACYATGTGGELSLYKLNESSSSSSESSSEVTPATLSSIAVKTAPTKTTYTEGENFDPTGLVITATYSDSSAQDVSYSSSPSSFTFSPTTSTALTTSNTSITITYSGKTCNQAITVNASGGSEEVTYTQLTSIASIDEEASYVLGVEGTGFHYSGTSSWGLCALPSSQTPLYYTLDIAQNGQSFTASTKISGTTYYLQIPTSKTFSMATSTGTNTNIIIGTTASVTGSTAYAVTNASSTARHLRINGTSGLRSYDNSTGSMAYFYKVNGETGGDTYTPFAVNTPAAMKFTNATSTYYFTGAMNGYYGAASTSISDAMTIYFETNGTGYNIYFNSNGKQYIEVVETVNGNKTYYNFIYSTSVSTNYGWKFDDSTGAYYYTVSGADYFIGSRDTYNTFGAYAMSNVSSSNYFHAQFVEIDSAEKWGQSFIETLTCNNGATAPSTSVWATLQTRYTNLSTYEKGLVDSATANENGTYLEQAIARYVEVLSKYSNRTSYPNYLNKAGYSNTIRFVPTTKKTSVALLAVFGIISVFLGIGFFSISTRKKNEN